MNQAFYKCGELKDVICYSEKVPNTTFRNVSYNPFEESYIEYATLHVPSSAIDSYRSAEPWNGFGKIVAIDGETPESKKCETPTISYEKGEIKFYCTTENAEFVSEITDTDLGKHYDSIISLSATYTITVYACKTGYDNSDTVSATLCWIDADPKTEGISNGVAQVRAYAVMIQSNAGTISVSGVDNGSDISVYSASGHMECSVKAHGNHVSLVTNLKKGEVAIVKIGDKSVKVVME